MTLKITGLECTWWSLLLKLTKFNIYVFIINYVITVIKHTLCQHIAKSNIRLNKLQKRCTRLETACDKVYQLLAHSRKFSPGIQASFTTKTGHRDIPEIVLIVVLNTKKTIKSMNQIYVKFHWAKWNQIIKAVYPGSPNLASITGLKDMMALFMVFNVTIKNISVISRWSLLLLEIRVNGCL